MRGPSGCAESTITVSLNGKALASHAFTSSDGEHGYGFAHGQWTLDSRFFVFNLSSSGGHQPMNQPLWVFDRHRARLTGVKLPPDFIPSDFRMQHADRLAVTGWSVAAQKNTDVEIDLGKGGA